MVVIRLARSGTKKRPFYRIVVTDNRNPRDGKFIEKVGFFDPLISNDEKSIYFNFDKINKWIKLGALLSKRVSALIKKKYKLCN